MTTRVSDEPLLSFAGPIGGGRYLLRRVPVGDWPNLEVYFKLPVGTNAVFTAEWESYDPIEDEYVAGRYQSWHVRGAAAGTTSRCADRVPHEGDYFSLFAGAAGSIDSCVALNTRRPVTALAPFATTPVGGAPGDETNNEGDLLFGLDAHTVPANTLQVWNLPHYHGPADLWATVAAGGGNALFELRSGDLTGAYVVLLDASGTALAVASRLWLPARIHTIAIRSTATPSTYDIAIVAARGPAQ